jgi:hypothetical protein
VTRIILSCLQHVTARSFTAGLEVPCTVVSVDLQLQGRSLAVIVWFVECSDQGEVHVFRGDLRRTARSKQCVGKLLAAVRFREPPCGGIDQGQALHRREVRLTLAQDCHSGQALPIGDDARSAKGPHVRLIAGTERRSGQPERPRQIQLIQVR